MDLISQLTRILFKCILMQGFSNWGLTGPPEGSKGSPGNFMGKGQSKICLNVLYTKYGYMKIFFRKGVPR